MQSCLPRYLMLKEETLFKSFLNISIVKPDCFIIVTDVARDAVITIGQLADFIIKLHLKYAV